MASLVAICGNPAVTASGRNRAFRPWDRPADGCGRCAQPADLLPRWTFTVFADLDPHGLNERLPPAGGHRTAHKGRTHDRSPHRPNSPGFTLHRRGRPPMTTPTHFLRAISRPSPKQQVSTPSSCSAGRPGVRRPSTMRFASRLSETGRPIRSGAERGDMFGPDRRPAATARSTGSYMPAGLSASELLLERSRKLAWVSGSRVMSG